MAAGELCVACINAATAASASSVAPTPQRATDANPPVLGTVPSLRGNWVGRRAWCRQLLIVASGAGFCPNPFVWHDFHDYFTNVNLNLQNLNLGSRVTGAASQAVT